MFAALLVSLLPLAAPATPVAVASGISDDPPVHIWLNNDRRYETGDRAKVRVETQDDGYLLVFHVDPDGRLRVLFPLDPTDDNYVRGGKEYELKGRGGREPFTVESGSGRGTVYAAVSPDPFRFDQYVLGDHWDYRSLNQQRYPEDAEPDLTELARAMAGGRFDYDIVTYDVYSQSVAYQDSYVAPTYTSSYYDPYCDPFWDSWCGPYYGNSVFLSIGFGRRHRRFFNDPFFYNPFYGPTFYDPWVPFYYPPRVYYPTYRPPRFGGGFGGFNSPYGFKQRDRTWDGGGMLFRDRTVGPRQVNTVYKPFPAQGRGIDLASATYRGRVPGAVGPTYSPARAGVAPPTAGTTPINSPRRRAESFPANTPSTAAPNQRGRVFTPDPRTGRPTMDGRTTEPGRRLTERPGIVGGRDAPAARPMPPVEARPSPSAAPNARPTDEPRLQPRLPQDARTYERDHPNDAPRRVGVPQSAPAQGAVTRSEPQVREQPNMEPRRVEPEPRQVAPPRMEPRAEPRPEPRAERPAPPPQQAAPQSQPRSEPRAEPRSGGGGGGRSGGGGGGRRHG